MDQNFRKRQQKTLYSGELEPAHNPLLLTELAVEVFHNLMPNEPDHVDLETASKISSQETVSPVSTVMGMMYARRLKRKRPDRLRKLTSSDLFLISMMMASKYLYDEGVDEEVFNDEWAENAGISEEEINNMELDFLDALEWELFIRKEDFERAMLSIEKSIAMKEGLKRGWFSYTDLCLLLEESWPDLSLTGATLQWIKVTVLCAAVYCATVVSCLLMVNAGMALTSTGLSPASLPTLPLTPAIPQSLSCDPPPSSTGISFPKEVSQTTTTTFRKNKTEKIREEGEVSLSPLGNEEQSEKTGDATDTVSTSAVNNEHLSLGSVSTAEESRSSVKNKDHCLHGTEPVDDTFMSQLMVVLSLESHLVEFVTAVSHVYRAATCTNLSTAETLDPSTHNPIGKAANEDDDRVSSVEEDLHSRPHHDPEECLQCNGGRSVDKGDMDRHDLSILDFQRLCNLWCKETGMGVRGPERDKQWHFQDIQQCQAECHTHVITSQTVSHQSVERDTASVHRLFPDVIKGFSTSMPAHVYAT